MTESKTNPIKFYKVDGHLSSSLELAKAVHAKQQGSSDIIWGIEEGDPAHWPLHQFCFDKPTKTWLKWPVCVMVSGHMDWTQDLFDFYYKPVLERCIRAGCEFVVGAAKGVDEMTQRFLASQSQKVCVTVYEKKSVGNPFIGASHFAVNLEAATFAERDAAMTSASDIDVVFLSQYGGPGSATAENIFRRARMTQIGVATLRDHMVKYDPELRVHCLTAEDKKAKKSE
jgi:hypothetical protein